MYGVVSHRQERLDSAGHLVPVDGFFVGPLLDDESVQMSGELDLFYTSKFQAKIIADVLSLRGTPKGLEVLAFFEEVDALTFTWMLIPPTERHVQMRLASEIRSRGISAANLGGQTGIHKNITTGFLNGSVFLGIDNLERVQNFHSKNKNALPAENRPAWRPAFVG